MPVSSGATGGVQAAGNLASKPTELKLAANTAKLTFSQTKFDLETGKYYKLTVSSDGKDSIDLKAPDLFWRRRCRFLLSHHNLHLRDWNA